MKKIVKRIALLACFMMLFSAPATALAASTPVLEFKDQGFTSIGFQPDPLFIAGGGSNPYELRDITYTDGSWYVPAGMSLNFQVFTNETDTTCRFLIYKNDSLVSADVYSSTIHGYIFRITPENNDVRWRFVIVPYTNATLLGYSGYIF